jgi:phage/plasmid primase-like uncharacterized protein
MIESGITPPVEVIDDGKIHRFSTNERNENKDGWYVLHGDGIPAGEYGCWRTLIQSKWKADLGRPYSPDELQALKERTELISKQREADFEDKAIKAADNANKIWSEATLASQHPYLNKKGIQPYIARESEGKLVIPLFKNGKIASLQFINQEGKKRFLQDGKVSGSYCIIGEIANTAPICICEGYATGASIYEATSIPVVIAFNAGNLLKVAQNIRELYPNHEVIIAGDDDWESEKNVGKIAAIEAAECVKAKLILPTFSEPRQSNQTDFNDMTRDQGLFVVGVAFMDLDAQEPLGPQKFTLKQFSLNGKSEEMKKQMLEDKYILGRIAIYGQYTIFYASPNVGKTLLIIWMLIRAIESGEIKGSDIFYINADDNHKGLAHKVALAERYGFHMLSPSYNGFESGKFFQYIQSMIDDDSVKGKIIVLDTLKKFTDVMSKGKSSEFGKMMRAFVLRGGSIICLGHTNKHKDLVGKSVYGGTSDITDDADCYYMLEEIQISEKTKTVRFENRKSRGDVDKTATFTYTNQKVMNYQELLDSVQPISESEAEAIAEINAINNRLTNNQEVIEAITSAIKDGITLKTKLIKSVAEIVCIGASKVKKVLDQHTGSNYSKGDRWTYSIGDKNGQTYSIITAGTGYKDQM